MFPTKETFQIFGFTSGHQNNFGIPIEEDERILRILNEEMLINQRQLNKTGDYGIGSTTDSSLYRTKVSPTLPIVRKNDVTTENIRVNASDDCKRIYSVICYDFNFFMLFRHLSINIHSVVSWNSPIRFNQFKNVQSTLIGGYRKLWISDSIELFITLASVCMHCIRAGMSTRTNGNIVAM